ncbi:unnamed protein product, partial [Allacma fusca]
QQQQQQQLQQRPQPPLPSHQQHTRSKSGGGGSSSERKSPGDELIMISSAPNPMIPSGPGEAENFESCSRNPLLCLICNSIYEDPRLLACFHSFCAKCLQGRTGETKIQCPICG